MYFMLFFPVNFNSKIVVSFLFFIPIFSRPLVILTPTFILVYSGRQTSV